MELHDFSQQLKEHSTQIDNLMRRRLPVIAGRMAKDFFQNSFRISAFVNNGNHPWQTTKRQQSGQKGAASNYNPLLSSRRHLFSSIKYTPSDYRCIVANDLLYAPIHNWGGTLHPTVTSKMRRFAWAMFYRTAGIKQGASKKTRKKNASASESNGSLLTIAERSEASSLLKNLKAEQANNNPEACKWRALALTKKKKLKTHIPQRQFLGESRELNDSIEQRTKQEIIKILDK